MASFGKFDISSGSPDRSLYSTGHHGSYVAGSMDRSASFRENMENPILSSLPSMSRSTSTVTQGDVTRFLQCLRFDPKSMAAEYKFNRHGDFKRLATAALSAPGDLPSSSFKGKPHSFSPEDLKRLRAGLRESAIKARERVKVFSESLLVVNKCFPNIPSRKRSRPDALSGDRANGSLADRAVTGAGKMGNQSLVPPSAFDFDQQKNEEKGKNTIPNKRTRTSMLDQRADVRPNTPARSSVSVDMDKEVLRLPNSNVIQCEDRVIPVVAEGWEKARTKKKRSVIKANAVPSPRSTSTKPIDGYREPKQGIYPRHLPDARSRLTDSYEFRAGAANGVVGAGNADGSSLQAISIGGRSSMPKLEHESAFLPHDKRERVNNSEKERTNIRNINKASVREEFISGSPTSTKLHATTRGPRSGSGGVPKISRVVKRSTSSDEWELPHGTSKNLGAVGTTNRKHTLSARSSSPPVAQWADRRPQKMSRTARRTNLVPVVSSNDEILALDSCDVPGSENGPGFGRPFPVNSPRQSKLKGDHLMSSGLSESEESSASEFRSKDKGKRPDEMEEKAGENVQKMSALVFPTRKNKLVNGEDNVDGVRRQGRTGRGSASARFSAPMAVEKIGNVGIAKQLRTSRLSFDKSESKPGLPPTRKLSDRKAYTRQKHLNFAAAFIVGSDDPHNELLGAESAAINPGQALSSPFWRQMEPLFGFLSDMDISYLKHQGSIQSTVTTTKPALLDVDSSNTPPNGVRVIKSPKNGTENRNTELNPEPLPPGTPSPVDISLCQRFLTALISEEEYDELTCNGNDDIRFNVYGSTFELERDLESKVSNHRSLQHDAFSGYGISSTLRSCNVPAHNLSDNHITSMPDSELATGFDSSYNGLLSIPLRTSEYHYGNMNERLLLEIQSLGLYPELLPDLAHTGDEDISGDISDLEKKHHEQVFRKTSLLDRLLKSITDAKDRQEKELKQHSLDKLTGMAYQKYMSCWGPNASGGKNASGKLAKQAALSFVKRTVERCQEFETTGKSCLTEPLFREMFVSGSSHFNDAQVVSVTDIECSQLDGNSMERVPGTHSLNKHDMYLSVNHSSEQTISKDELWSSRVKKRELYLDNVVVGTSAGTTILNGAKGKRSERDREWKNGGCKVGRPASSNSKGERKTKAKLKQKATQLSASVNGPLGKLSDQHKPTISSVPKSVENKISNVKENEKYNLLETEEPLDFSHLQLPEMDVLGVGDDFDEQGQDIGSWLNIDDDGLQDDDFMGLEIPMDDLSDLNMMV